MLSILLIESCRDIADRVERILSASEYTLQARMDSRDPMAILNYTQQKKPEVIVCCAWDVGPDLYNDVELFHEARQSGCTAQILLLVARHSREVHRLALEFDVEWVISLEEEGDLLINALRRMERKQKQIRHSRREKFQRLFVDYLLDQRRLTAADKYTLLHNYDSEQYFRIAVVRTLPPYRKRGVVEENTLVSLKGYDILSGRLQCLRRYLAAKNGLDVLVCMMGTREELEAGKQQLLLYLNDMREFNHTIARSVTWVCMGTIVEDMAQIGNSYRDAVCVLEERILQKGGSMLEQKDAPGTGDEEEHFEIFDVRKTLTNAIETFEALAIHKALTQLKSNILSSADFRGITLLSIYKTLLSVLYRELEIKEIPQSRMSMDYHTAEQEYSFFWDINDVFDTLESLFLEGMKLVEKQEEESVPVPIVLAKRYIRSYFNMPLTLQEISEYVGMTENYFSDYFSKCTKMTFKQYQTDLRIRYAKQMLLDKRYTMEDISEAVGYSDVKYFSRVFKQVTGIAPGEYRKKYHVAKR